MLGIWRYLRGSVVDVSETQIPSTLDSAVNNLFQVTQNQSEEVRAGHRLQELMFRHVLNEFAGVSNIFDSIFSQISEMSLSPYKFEEDKERVEAVRSWQFIFPEGAKNRKYHPEVLTLPLTHPAEMMRFFLDKTACLAMLFCSSEPARELTFSGADAYALRSEYFSKINCSKSVLLCVHEFRPWEGSILIPTLKRHMKAQYRSLVNSPENWPLIESAFQQERMQTEVTVRSILKSSFYYLLTDNPVLDKMSSGWARNALNAAKTQQEPQRNLRFAYQIVLYKIIERVYSINSKKGEKTGIELIQLKSLDWLFDEVLQKTKELQVPVSFSTIVRAEVIALLTLGLYSSRIVPLEEFKLRMELAKRGCSFFEQVSELLEVECPEIQSGTFGLIMKLLEEFQDWAGEYPDQALDMMSSIWHAAGVFQSEEFTRRIQTGLTGKYFTHSLLSAMGESNRKREKDPKRYLKFVCLWECCHYLPHLADLARTGLNFQGGYLEFMNLGWRIIKVNLEQRVIQAVPGEWAGNVALIAEVVRGESLYHILQTNAQLQLLGVAGQIGGFLWNPGNLISLIKIEFLNWWKPLKNLSLRVAAVHIGIPLVGIAGLSLSLMSLPLIPGGIVGFSLLAMAYQLYKNLRASNPENYAEVMLRDPKLRGEITREVRAYLKNARKLYSVVQVHSNEVSGEGDASEVIKALASQTPKDASEAIKCFNKALKGKEDSVIRKAELEWLEPTLIEIFMKEACKFYLEKTHASDLSVLPVKGKREWSSEEIRSIVRHQLGTRSRETESVIQSIF